MKFFLINMLPPEAYHYLSETGHKPNILRAFENLSSEFGTVVHDPVLLRHLPKNGKIQHFYDIGCKHVQTGIAFLHRYSTPPVQAIMETTWYAFKQRLVLPLFMPDMAKDLGAYALEKNHLKRLQTHKYALHFLFTGPNQLFSENTGILVWQPEFVQNTHTYPVYTFLNLATVASQVHDFVNLRHTYETDPQPAIRRRAEAYQAEVLLWMQDVFNLSELPEELHHITAKCPLGYQSLPTSLRYRGTTAATVTKTSLQ